MRKIILDYPITIVSGVGVIFLLLVSLSNLNEPLIADEAIFANVMRSLVETGLPKYYAGEPVGWSSGLWHPPTYIYYGAGWLSTFGVSSPVARSGTFVFTLLTVPAVALLGKKVAEITGDGSPAKVAAISVLIYVTAPLTIQNGTLVDIDGSVLALVITLFLYWILDNFESSEPNWPLTLIFIACWVALVSWIKFGVLPVLLSCVTVYVLYDSGLKRGIQTVGAIISGFCLFTVSWAAVAAILDISFIHPFVHNISMILESGQQVSVARRLLLSSWSFYVEVLWISPFLLALGILAALDRIPTTVTDLRQLSIRIGPGLLLGIALLTIIQYAILAKIPYGFPKYLGVATPLLSALAGSVTVRTLQTGWNQRKSVFAVGLIAVIGVGMILIGDPFLVSFEEGYLTVVIQTAVTIVGMGSIGVAVAVLLLRSNLLSDPPRIVTLLFLVMLLGTSFGIVAHQATADYSTRYHYGITETEPAIDDTNEIYTELSVSEQKESVLPVDFGFYIDGQFHRAQGYTVSDLEADSPPLVVLRTETYYKYDSSLRDRLAASERYNSEQHGSYTIFRRTSAA